MSSNLKMCSRCFTSLFSETCLPIDFYKYQKWVLITLRSWEHWDWEIGLYKGDVCGQETDRKRRETKTERGKRWILEYTDRSRINSKKSNVV